MAFLEDVRLFFSGAFDMRRKSRAMILDAYEDEVEEFFILCFSDLLGIDLPTGYYALELYPFLAEDIERWQRKSNDRLSVWEQKGASLDIDP